ncbi:hypothetical protein HZH68_007755 [Vespula germanica]|uniref:Uncharacterized protein n=1 Tax=Vespula germanica TaxID=30212 RepID=A0A834K2Z0_VESGE|nr:hypothetical protein HZH68_007755 [Vespula germanica]
MCIDRVGVRVERHGTLLPRGSNSPDVIGIQFLPLTATIATAFAAVSATAVIATWQVHSNGVRTLYGPGDKIPGKFCEPFELGYVEEVLKEWYGGVSWKSGTNRSASRPVGGNAFIAGDVGSMQMATNLSDYETSVGISIDDCRKVRYS